MQAEFLFLGAVQNFGIGNLDPGAKIKTPKVMDVAFAELDGTDGQRIHDLVAAYSAEQATKLEQELFKQRKRLADAERVLQSKTTKAATESKRIATDKVAWAMGKLADLRRAELVEEDSRVRDLASDEKEENVVLEFRPGRSTTCWWRALVTLESGADEPKLLSFAAITDEPPPEVAAAGHGRCIVPIKPENLDAWLNPDPANLAQQYAILTDRDWPYYEHRMAA